eukprot:TRINITY_DN37683_c0_g1_i1.p1 TRINITY_DN37683_c0_g1~~TRINITY_DN37683_c0_g1_i1.p1  ORF type:complete len:304 (-),score=30.20 TRINITY_DN37683_c0_g1_i1:407-1318(-)
MMLSRWLPTGTLLQASRGTKSCFHFGAAGLCRRTSDVPYVLPTWLCRPDRCNSAVRLPYGPGTQYVEPGLVVVRGVVAPATQRKLAAEAWAAGTGCRNPNHTFFEKDGTLRGPKGSRGRIFDALSNFDARLTGLLLPACEGAVETALAVDSRMPSHCSTHLLLLFYRTGGTLGFHRDVQANDGTGEEPVVNISLGGDMDFAVRHDHSEVARVLTLCSGDVVLFGGPCRKILHAVVDTRRDPISLVPCGGRLSFTLRHAPEVLGQEHLYKHFRPQREDPHRRTTGDHHILGEEEAEKRLRAMRE